MMENKDGPLLDLPENYSDGGVASSRGENPFAVQHDPDDPWTVDLAMSDDHAEFFKMPSNKVCHTNSLCDNNSTGQFSSCDLLVESQQSEASNTLSPTGSSGSSGGFEPDQSVFEEDEEDLAKAAEKEIEDNDLSSPSAQPARRLSKSVSFKLPDKSKDVDDFTDISRHRIISVAGDDKIGRRVVVFSACRLPPSYQIDHSRLLRYLKYTLDQYVENDYSIVYFHFGLNSKNKPALSWSRSIYQELERKYKKNLKDLYIVHPSNFIKVMMNIFKPLISRKFGRKIHYLNRLEDLQEYVHCNQLDIPPEVIEHDKKVAPKYKPKTPQATAVFHTKLDALPKTQQFGVSIKRIKECYGEDDPIPPVVRISVEYLLQYGLHVEGIFRRSSNTQSVKDIAAKFNQGEFVDFSATIGVHGAAVILKKFLRELPEPLLTFKLYDPILEVCAIPEEQRLSDTQLIIMQLPAENYSLLQYLMQFLKAVLANANQNKMTAVNLAIVFGPNLIWSPFQAASLSAMGQINSFTKIMLDNIDTLFVQDR